MNFKILITVICRVLAVVLVLAVLFPSALKLSHAFTHHKHNVCSEDTEHNTHFHQSDIDCNFFNFKLTKQYHFNNSPIHLVSIKSNFKISDSQYEFASDYQKLQTALRGPPQLIY